MKEVSVEIQPGRAPSRIRRFAFLSSLALGIA